MVLLLATRGSVVAFAGIVAAFHVLRPDVDPLTRGISRYQWGPHGMVMSVGFVLLAIALLGAARAIQRQQRKNVFPSSLLTVSALGSLLVAAFPLPESPPFAAAVAHQSGGFALFVAAGLAAGVVPIDSGGVAGRLGRLTATLVILFLLTIVMNVPLVGLLQRLVLATLCVWIVRVTKAGGRLARP